MKSIRGIFVILLAVSLIVAIGVPKLWAQEGMCLMLAEIAVEAMELGYQTQSYEACQELVDALLKKNLEDPLPSAWQPFFTPRRKKRREMIGWRNWVIHIYIERQA